MPNSAIRTRFAPSPTGHLHLGGARTALFSWAYARQHEGVFVLRIEDTDQVRSFSKYTSSILESLNWLGIQIDEEPVYQTDRIAHYKRLAEYLLEKKMAYKCYATSEELEQLRKSQLARREKPRYDRRWRDVSMQTSPNSPYTIRFKTPLEGSLTFKDKIRGEILINNSELDDPIIMRSDGTPTYNFTVAIDDADMKISDVIRGEDHISNTPRQIHILNALGHDAPQYAHLPLILSLMYADGHPVLDDQGNHKYGRMSKREGASNVLNYREDGYPAKGIFNYLASLGWAPKDAEIFEHKEFIQRFDLSTVNHSAARFDINKLRWVCQKHIEKQPHETLMQSGLSENEIELVKGSISCLRDIDEKFNYLKNRPLVSQELLSQYLSQGNLDVITSLIVKLSELENWSTDFLSMTLKTIVTERKMKFKDLGMPVRILLTGKKESPDIVSLMSVLGKKEVLSRLSRESNIRC